MVINIKINEKKNLIFFLLSLRICYLPSPIIVPDYLKACPSITESLFDHHNLTSNIISCLVSSTLLYFLSALPRKLDDQDLMCILINFSI